MVEPAPPIDGGVIDVTNPVSAADIGVENITVTIQNYGSDALSGFMVNYSVDGGATISETYAGSIAAYTTASYTFTSSYDFSADVCYEINAWTSIADDANMDNDSYTENVCNLGPVTGTGAVYVYSSLPGGEPWFSTTNSTAMTTVFGAEGIGWNRAFFESLLIPDVFSSDNCFVFVDGSDLHADDLEAFLAANGDYIESWVELGGKLLLNSAPNEGDGMSFGFDGNVL